MGNYYAYIALVIRVGHGPTTLADHGLEGRRRAVSAPPHLQRRELCLPCPLERRELGAPRRIDRLDLSRPG